MKIVGNGMPGDGGQRPDADAAGLAHPDSQCGVLPINVIHAQRRYLKGAETEVHEAANDCVIALTLWIRLLKGRHQPGECLLVEVLRQRSQLPARRLGNRRQERIDRICTPQGAKPQIAPNGGCHDVCAARLISTGNAQLRSRGQPSAPNARTQDRRGERCE